MDNVNHTAQSLPDLFPPEVRRSPVMDFVHRHPAIVIGGGILVLLILVAVMADWLGTIDPEKITPTKRNRGPSEDFWFGTDTLGRDLYSRVIFGTRISLLVGFAVALVASFLGVVTGLIAGAVRPLDSVIMRVMDGLMSIPPILLAIALMAVSGGSVINVIFAISMAEFPRMSRLVRGLVLSIREEDYVDGAIAAGCSTAHIIWRHILPNTLGPVLVQATYICSAAMITEAALSFIGAGTPPSIPTWGGIMNEGRMLWQIQPHIMLFPALLLSISILAVNILGDGLRDALDPRSASRM